jgi:hypothetical protein
LLLAPFLLLALFLGYARATEEAALVKDINPGASDSIFCDRFLRIIEKAPTLTLFGVTPVPKM